MTDSLSATYLNKNPIIRIFSRTKIRIAIKMAKLKKAELILDFGCFPKGTLIYNDKLEEIPIEKIKKNDFILTANGNFEKVTKTFKRKYKGEIYKIDTLYGHSLSATKEHPILSIKREEVGCNSHGIQHQRTCNTNLNGTKCSMCGGENKYLNPEYRCVSTLKKQDYIALPRNIRTNVRTNKNNIRLARLLGWYLAEGNQIYSHKPKVCGVSFNLALKEMRYAEEIKELATELGATSVTIFKREKRNTITINCFGKKLAELLFKLGGKYSDKKSLDPLIFNWNKNEHVNLLQSYFLGEGYYRKGEYVVKSVSKNLIQHIKLIFNKYGISPGFNSYKSKNKKRYYSIILSGDGIPFLRISEKYPSKKRYRINKDYIFIPISKISKKNSELMVYNLEVDNEHSYIASGISVHNCGAGWLKALLRNKGYKVIGYDITPEHTDIDDYTKLKPDKIFALDVFEHISKKEIIEIIKNFKKMNPNFELITAIPTENFISRKTRKLLGKTERVADHITSLKEILAILKKELKLVKRFNFLSVSYIAKFKNTN